MNPNFEKFSSHIRDLILEISYYVGIENLSDSDSEALTECCNKLYEASDFLK